jgi:hypothetical protein
MRGDSGNRSPSMMLTEQGTVYSLFVVDIKLRTLTNSRESRSATS